MVKYFSLPQFQVKLKLKHLTHIPLMSQFFIYEKILPNGGNILGNLQASDGSI